MRCPVKTFGAVIMAGGSGTRMGTLTRNTPKPLLKIGGHATLDYLLGSLEYHGIPRENIVVIASVDTDGNRKFDPSKSVRPTLKSLPFCKEQPIAE